uniref:Cysteine-rich motor neuron 1 protein n=2 Tax=Magallana gigas TaxID=29159 RepID=A0A8W8MZ76_MAGGI|nr:uncharacterized protein LOC105319545 [Crassostrea gigas]
MKCLLTPLLISFCFFNCVQAYRAANPDPNNEFDKCDFGRHLTKRCVGETMDPQLSVCPTGFFCFTPVDGEGPCCRRDNPCSTGVPYKVSDDAVTCSQRKRCPSGHVCTTGKGYAVCCPAHRLCPRPNNCPIISPPRCARPTTFRYKGGLICPGCDKNVCKRSKNHYKK